MTKKVVFSICTAMIVVFSFVILYEEQKRDD